MGLMRREQATGDGDRQANGAGACTWLRGPRESLGFNAYELDPQWPPSYENKSLIVDLRHRRKLGSPSDGCQAVDLAVLFSIET